MRGHIIRSLGRMRVQGVVLWHQTIEPSLEISLRGWIGVLLNRQAR